MARHSNLGRPDRSGRVTTVSSVRRRIHAKRIQKDQLEDICLNGTLRVLCLVSWRGF